MVTTTDILTWTITAFLILLLYVSFLTLWRHSRRFNKAFRDLALERGGTAETGFLAFPSARVPLGGAEATVRGAYASQYSSNVVEVSVEPARPWPGRLAIFPPAFHTAILSLLRAGRTRTGDADFDRAFVVFGSPPEMAEPILDAETRETLLAATALGRRGDVVLLLHPTALKLRKYNVTPDPMALTLLLTATELVYRKVEALRTGNLEIEYLEGPFAPAPGSCPTCGSDLETDVVWCKRCRTPHHKECWRYNRGCATFACGEDRFTRKEP
ncbi:MAG: RING finger protein [Planctomycetota bacterium]|jgi:hypothetical protein